MTRCSSVRTSPCRTVSSKTEAPSARTRTFPKSSARGARFPGRCRWSDSHSTTSGWSARFERRRGRKSTRTKRGRRSGGGSFPWTAGRATTRDGVVVQSVALENEEKVGVLKVQFALAITKMFDDAIYTFSNTSIIAEQLRRKSSIVRIERTLSSSSRVRRSSKGFREEGRRCVVRLRLLLRLLLRRRRSRLAARSRTAAWRCSQTRRLDVCSRRACGEIRIR